MRQVKLQHLWAIQWFCTNSLVGAPCAESSWNMLTFISKNHKEKLEGNGPVERACEPTCPGRRRSRPGRRQSQICESVAVLAVHIWMKFGTAVYSTSSAASESPTIWSKVQTFCTGSLVAGPSAQSSYKIKLIFLSKSHLRKTRQFKSHALAEAFLLNIFIFGHVINS